MKNIVLLPGLFLCLSLINSWSQSLYFPPLSGNVWETTDPSDFNWCQERLDSLYDFLDEKNSKAFIILVDGKMVVEKYFDSFTQDSLWYYASAGKSVTSVMVGLAREEGLLELDDKTSDYLGTGWTTAPPDKEALITIRHQLTMTSGLDDAEEDLDGISFCLDPECLKYKADAGTRWAYHNAPYLLLHDVLEEASGQNINLYYYNSLAGKIGMGGLWVNGVLVGKPRDAARFGLFMLAEGSWNGLQILTDSDYFQEMRNTSQSLNESYGYLWWLNGKESFMLPVLRNIFNGPLIPAAPDDMYAALGKNDQKIYVVPSRNMVVVRMGESASGSTPSLSSFDNVLWEKISNLACGPTSSTNPNLGSGIEVFPNPAGDFIRISANESIEKVEIRDMLGRVVISQNNIYKDNFSIPLPRQITSGMAVLAIYINDKAYIKKIIINNN